MTKILNEVAFEFVCNSDFTRKFAEVKKYLVKQKSYLDTNCDFTKHSTSLCRHKIHLIVPTCGRFHFGMKLIMKKHFYFDEFQFKEVILRFLCYTNFYDYLLKKPSEIISPLSGPKEETGEESLSHFLASQTLQEQIYNDTVFPTIISDLRTLMTRWEETLHTAAMSPGLSEPCGVRGMISLPPWFWQIDY